MNNSSEHIKLTFLGTGTSQGIPIITCQCPVCLSEDARDKRLRTSAHIEVDGLSLVIDTGPDFRQQMIRAQVKTLDAILFTHDHKDHTGGLDDVRPYNYTQQKPMEVYAESNVLDTLKREYSYAFARNPYPGVPQIHLNEITNQAFYIKDTLIEPIRGLHYQLPILGYKIKNLAYITDMKTIEPKEIEKLKNVKVLVINALRFEKHMSHFCLEEALDIIEKSGVETAYLTHMSHELGFHKNISRHLPKHVHPAYDGLQIEL